jgi:hypothetical protein
MEQSDLYHSIFKRRSIRKYDLSALDKNMLLKISQQINKLKPLYPDIKTEIKIVSPQDVKGIIQVKAPHYIAAFSEVKEGYLTNIGFLLQQMDLYFSANGIGSCWQGWPKPTRELRIDKDLEFIIVLAFGMSQENLYRESVNKFKRKTLHQITDLENFNELLEPARLAPSPSQPWYFTGEKNIIHIFCKNTNGFLSKMSQGLNRMEERLKKIEIGIATCHLWIAALHFNKNIKFLLHPHENINTPQNYVYIISANIL